MTAAETTYLIRLQSDPNDRASLYTLCAVEGVEPMLSVVGMLFSPLARPVHTLTIEVFHRPPPADSA